MKLYCVRHGEAESSEINSRRPLTQEGQKGITKLADYLAALGLHISSIMHSNKLRAIQTASIIAEKIGVDNVTECPTLLDENAKTEAVVALINASKEDIMLVGHLPFMYKLVDALIIGNEDYYPIVNFVPGTVVCLDFDENQWMINWIINPKIIPDLGKR